MAQTNSRLWVHLLFSNKDQLFLKDGATLLADFWTEVDAVLKETGVIP